MYIVYYSNQHGLLEEHYISSVFLYFFGETEPYLNKVRIK